MRIFRATYYQGGLCHSFIIRAKDRDEALEIAWSEGLEDIYISEVNNNEN